MGGLSSPRPTQLCPQPLTSGGATVRVNWSAVHFCRCPVRWKMERQRVRRFGHLEHLVHLHHAVLSSLNANRIRTTSSRDGNIIADDRDIINAYSRTYTPRAIKTCHYILDDNSHDSWWIFTLLVSMERGMDTLQRSYKIYNFLRFLIKSKNT